MENSKTYFNEKYAEIRYSKERDLMDVIWKEPISEANQYKLTLSKAIVVLKQYNVKNWVTDISLKASVSSNEREWIRRYLIPYIKDLGLKKIALIVGEKQKHSSDYNALKEMMQEEKICIRIFEKKYDAYKWAENECTPVEF